MVSRLEAFADQATVSPVFTQSGNTPWAQRYSQELRDVVLRYAARLPRSVQRHLGPSELGEQCPRKTVGKMAGVQLGSSAGAVGSTYAWSSIVGTALHAFMDEAFTWDAEHGLNPGRWLTERRVTPDPGAPSPHPGTADMFDNAYQAVVDWKMQSDAVRTRLRRDGLPYHYHVQMLLYAVGYMHLGFPVDRIVLVSWPRTKSTLDDVYVFEKLITAEDLRLVRRVLDETEDRERAAVWVADGSLSFWDVPPVPSAESCQFCFRGDTRVVTRQGVRAISDLAAVGSAELLVPAMRGSAYTGRGSFKRVPVRYFGDQELLEIRLGGNRAEKVVHATQEHRWVVLTERPGQRERQVIKTTAELRAGDRLKSLRASIGSRPEVMEVAVAQGFTFGDGKDEAMLRFLSEQLPVSSKYLTRLPRFWKQLPPVDESRSFLLSWLAGYFAADGTVSTAGQCSISSANREHLEFVRDVAAICGIGATEATDLHHVNLRRRDLPPWFFLIDEHRRRAQAANDKRVISKERDPGWRVVSVERTGVVEPVFCAVVEGTEAFALADDLMTMNCPYHNPAALQDGTSKGCPGMAFKR